MLEILQPVTSNATHQGSELIEETITMPNVAALKLAISEQWKNVPAGEAAIQIINGLEAQASPAAEWSLTEILGLLGPSAGLQETIPALAILT